jgi:L-ascorbate metabolism protein UlaG (beta-lactamase superfamily)
MRITWYGHAAFLVETEGRRIILDPYRSPDCGGYAPIAEPADVVVVSHENDRYHSHLGQIVPPFEVVRALEVPPEGVVVRGIRFEAIPCFESPEKLPGDEVTIVHFRSEGLHVVFLGDLGHALSDAELAPLRGADVVLVPAGGPPTLPYADIRPLLEAIEPRVVLPMHYLVPGKINLPIQPVESFFAALPDWPVERLGASTIELDSANPPPSCRIIRLEPAR